MTHDIFDRALAFTLEWEGGHVHDPDDPGGETKYGISRLAYPHVDIAALTREQAAAIYRQYYWDVMQLDEVARISEDLAVVLFDTAVNVGVWRTVLWLQEIVFANTDGVLGPRTLREIETHLGYEPDIKLILRRYAHYTDLAERHEWARNYLLGWCRRTKALWEEVR